MLYFCSYSFAQKEIIRSGLLRAQLTYSASKMFKSNATHYYLHGNLEGYLNKRISLTGDGYYYLTNGGANATDVIFNHSAFFGAAYHCSNKANDFYFGVQPGLSFAQFSSTTFLLAKPQKGVSPLFSATIGYNLYFYKFFHFFVQSRLILGKHNYYPTHSLNEIRFSAGLGFNINSLKSAL